MFVFSCFKGRTPAHAVPKSVAVHRSSISTQPKKISTISVQTTSSKVDKVTQSGESGGFPQRGWAVFWDFENMTLWKRYKSLSDIVRSIRACLFKISGANAVDPHVTRIYGIGNMTRIPPEVRKKLEQNGIKTMDSPSRQKNAADVVIVTEIMRCLIDNPPQGVCLISNDGDFSHCMRTVKQLGYTTALLHDNPSRELCQTVSNSINSIDLSATYAHKTIQTTSKRTRLAKVRPGRETMKDTKESVVHASRSIKAPPPTYTAPRNNYGHFRGSNDFRPGLTHVVRTLEIAGGCLEYGELQRRLGALPYGWLASLIESGQALQRLALHGNWVVLPRYPYYPRPPLVSL